MTAGLTPTDAPLTPDGRPVLDITTAPLSALCALHQSFPPLRPPLIIHLASLASPLCISMGGKGVGSMKYW